MYFALAHIMNAFCYLKYGLAGILGFAGVKMILADVYHVPVELSLAAIVLILGVAIIASLIRNRRVGACPVVEEVKEDTCPALKELGPDDVLSGTSETDQPSIRDLKEGR